jgi:hypothetical protein
MSLRTTLALAISSATILAACSDAAHIAEPEIHHPAVAFAIVPALACTGETMSATECEALVALYNETNGPGWTNSNGWGVELNPCDWHGVICNAGGSVRFLSLSANGLSGPIPGALGNLPDLERILLSNNSLTGPIPNELGSLAKLEALSLNANQITGTIPGWLSDLPQLEYLGLAHNQLTGSIPANFDNLASNAGDLLLHANQLGGLVPLAVAQYGGAASLCALRPGNDDLFLPDVAAYRDADIDGDGLICGLGFSSVEDFVAAARAGMDGLDAFVSSGRAGALKSKLESAIGKADSGDYAGAVKQLQNLMNQLQKMVANGTLPAEFGTTLIHRLGALAAIWTELL